MYMITEDEPSYHAIALYRRLSKRPHRILYVGLDHQLMEYLQDELEDCWIVRAPAACVARIFIRKLKYSLLLSDEVLMDATAQELASFAREFARKKGTPFVVVKDSDDDARLARAVRRLLPRSVALRPAWEWSYSRMDSLAC
jgi:hypothetical protein